MERLTKKIEEKYYYKSAPNYDNYHINGRVAKYKKSITIEIGKGK